MSQANNFASTSTVNFFTISRNSNYSSPASISHDSVRITTPNEKEGITGDSKEINSETDAETHQEKMKKKKTKNPRQLLRLSRKRNELLKKRTDIVKQLLQKMRRDNVLTDLYIENLLDTFPEAVTILKEID